MRKPRLMMMNSTRMKKPAKTKTTTTSTSSTSTTSASPKTSDQGAPVTLVYVSLAAAALAVYAAKTRQRTVLIQKTRWIPPVLMDWRNSFCIWDF